MADGYLGTKYSKAELEMRAEADHYKEKAKLAAKEHNAQMDKLKYAGIGAASVAAVGYVSGRYPGKTQVGGIPIIAVAAVLGLGAAASGYLSKDQAEIALSIGSSSAAAFAYNAAYNKGAGKPLIASVTT